MPTATRRPPTVRLSNACSNVARIPDGVERDIELAPAGDFGELAVQVVVPGVEREVRADLERPLPDGWIDVDGDDRYGSHQAGELHDVGPHPADTPHAHRLAHGHLAGVRQRRTVWTASARIAACSSGTSSGTRVSPAAGRRCIRPTRRHGKAIS